MESDASTDTATEPNASGNGSDGSGEGDGSGAPGAVPEASLAPAPAPLLASRPDPNAPAPFSLDEIAEETESSVIDEIMATCSLEPKSDQFALVADGVRALLRFLIRTELHEVDVPVCDLVIAELTQKMSRQIDTILHHERFQELESAWRALKFVVDRVQFRENIRLEMLNISKRDLLEDFQDSPEIPKSGMFRIVYSTEYGQFGGRPYGVIIGNYSFGPMPQDIALLGDIAAVASMSHAPFIAAASPKFFGLDDFLRLPHLNELHALFSGPQYTKWQAFRDGEDSRYVGLVLPRFLLRLPYGPNANRVKAFEYEEDVVGKHEAYLWGNPAFAMATRIAESFARYRWCPHIIGPSSGGTVEDLPLHQYEAMGHIQTKIPTEIVVSERREFAIAEEGFISFTYRPDTANACFFSANSVQKPKYFGISKDGREAELSFRLGTQLPYLFIVSRLAHYIKVIQRENIGSWKERNDLEHELQKWLRQYVADQDVVSASVRARRPLRKAQITISDVAGNAGWYKIDLQVQPHFRYMGAVFHLGLVGRMEQD